MGLAESIRPRGRVRSAGRRQSRQPGYGARRAGRRPDGVAGKAVVAGRAHCRGAAETTRGSIGPASTTFNGGRRYVAGLAAVKVEGANGLSPARVSTRLQRTPWPVR